MTHQGAGVDATDPHHAVAAEPALEILTAAPVAGHRRKLAHNHAAHVGMVGFVVLSVHPRVAQFRIGEGHQLTRVAGIGHHLLIARHAGVEDHLTDHGAPGPEGQAPQHGAIGQHQESLLGRRA